MAESAITQSLLTADQRGVGAKEDELTDRISEETVSDREAIGNQLLWRALIGRQKHLKGSSLGNLRINCPVAPKLKTALCPVLDSKSCAPVRNSPIIALPASVRRRSLTARRRTRR